MVLTTHTVALNQDKLVPSASVQHCMLPCDCHHPFHSSIWPASRTALSLPTAPCIYTHLYCHLLPKVTFSKMLLAHKAKGFSSLLLPIFLSLSSYIFLYIIHIYIRIYIYLNIITYVECICFQIYSVSLMKMRLHVLFIYLPLQGNLVIAFILVIA